MFGQTLRELWQREDNVISSQDPLEKLTPFWLGLKADNVILSTTDIYVYIF